MTSSPPTHPTISWLQPGALTTPTGGFVYNRRIMHGLRADRWTVDPVILPDSFPTPSPADRKAALDALAAVPDGRLTVIDGLAGGVLADELAAHAERLPILALVHHPLCDETGLDADTRDRLADSERRALSVARQVVVTSPSTQRRLADFHVPDSRIACVIPGTEHGERARGSDGPGVAMICVASLTPRKGHAVLIDALGGLIDRKWTLTLVGPARDGATKDDLERRIAAHGLSDRITIAGALDDAMMRAAYDDADLFVLASHYEGFGMVIGEAVGHGLPIVTTTGGALAETLPPGAGIAVAPGDVAALRDALAAVLDDAGLRARLAQGSWASRHRFPDWPSQARAFGHVLTNLMATAL